MRQERISSIEIQPTSVLYSTISVMANLSSIKILRRREFWKKLNFTTSQISFVWSTSELFSGTLDPRETARNTCTEWFSATRTKLLKWSLLCRTGGSLNRYYFFYSSKKFNAFSCKISSARLFSEKCPQQAPS